MVEATTPSHDDDDKFLYGENTDASKTKTNGVTAEVSASESLPTTTATSVLPSQETKKESQDEDGDGDDDEEGEFEEESDDDDIQVHIGEVNTATPGGPYGTPVNWKKDSQATTTVAANKLAALPTQGQKKIDVNAVGLINGQPIYEYDLDTEQDEKPWRKPGADISDYFNYGFNEETWKQYCDKQRRMRMESQRSPYTVTQGVGGPLNHSTQNAQVEIEVLPDGRTRVKAGPPPDRKVEGSIHVLGSTEDARRKQKEDELLALALNSTRVLPPGFPGQRPLYTALPGGAVVYNPIPGQQMPPQMMTPLPPSSQDNSQDSSVNASEAPNTSQPQQIQSLGGPPVVQYLGPGGPQLPPGLQQMIPNNAPPGMFQPPGGPPMGMEFQQDPFMHPNVMMPPMGPGGFNQFAESDSERESDGGDGRRHRSSRRESKHRRHRDRSDRGERSERDKDRDHRDRTSSRRERERGSDARRSHDHSKTSSSDRKSKHSSRSIKTEDDGTSERKPRVSSRRSRGESGKPSSGDVTVDDEASTREPRESRETRESREPREAREPRETRDSVKKEPSERTVEVKQEPSGD